MIFMEVLRAGELDRDEIVYKATEANKMIGGFKKKLAVLKQYAAHDGGCPKDWDEHAPECTCGLDKLKEEI